MASLGGSIYSGDQYRGLQQNPVPERTVRQSVSERRAECIHQLEGLDSLLLLLPDKVLDMRMTDFLNMFTRIV